MKDKDIEGEVFWEFKKKPRELAKDIIREANTLPEKPAGEKRILIFTRKTGEILFIK